MHADASYKSINIFAPRGLLASWRTAGGDGGDADSASAYRRQPPRFDSAGVVGRLIRCVRGLGERYSLSQLTRFPVLLHLLPSDVSPGSTGCVSNGVQAQATSSHGNASAHLDKRGIRHMRTKGVGPYYVPPRAEHCRQCATCKEQRTGNGLMAMTLTCRSACKKCPDTVVLGAERVLSIEVDGFLAMEYRRDTPAGAQGRVLQRVKTDNGLLVVQSADALFLGSYRNTEDVRHLV